jgi:hypothetical protein
MCSLNSHQFPPLFLQQSTRGAAIRQQEIQPNRNIADQYETIGLIIGHTNTEHPSSTVDLPQQQVAVKDQHRRCSRASGAAIFDVVALTRRVRDTRTSDAATDFNGGTLTHKLSIAYELHARGEVIAQEVG